MHAERHAELGEAGAAASPSQRLERAEHAARCGCAATFVRWSGEQEQERVTAELEAIATEQPGDIEQLGEHRVQRVGELLCTDLAAAGQPFGQRREPGDL